MASSGLMCGLVMHINPVCAHVGREKRGREKESERTSERASERPLSTMEQVEPGGPDTMLYRDDPSLARLLLRPMAW